MGAFKVSVRVVAVIIFVHTSLANNPNRMHQEWIKNTERSAKFKCALPQARSIDVRDLLDDSLLNSVRQIQPPSTVLHRCGASGCCAANRTCSPVANTTQDVKLVFLTISGRRKHNYVEVNVKNHTRCGCHHPHEHAN